MKILGIKVPRQVEAIIYNHVNNRVNQSIEVAIQTEKAPEEEIA